MIEKIKEVATSVGIMSTSGDEEIKEAFAIFEKAWEKACSGINKNLTKISEAEVEVSKKREELELLEKENGKKIQELQIGIDRANKLIQNLNNFLNI